MALVGTMEAHDAVQKIPDETWHPWQLQVAHQGAGVVKKAGLDDWLNQLQKQAILTGEGTNLTAAIFFKC